MLKRALEIKIHGHRWDMRNKKNKRPKLEKFIHLLSWMELQEASEFQNCTVHVTEEKGEGFVSFFRLAHEGFGINGSPPTEVINK